MIHGNKIFLNKINKELDIEELLNLTKLDFHDIVFLGGSLIEGQINPNSKGIGNSKSDLDVFVITSEDQFLQLKSEYTQEFRKVCFYRINNINIDIEYFSIKFINELVHSVNQLQLNINTRVFNSLMLPKGIDFYETNTFLSRLKNSIGIYNLDAYEKLISEFSYESFLEWYKMKIINSMNGILEDATGNLDEKNYDTALWCIRNYYLEFMQYILYNNKEFVDRDKWTLLKFKNLTTSNPDLVCVWDLYNNLFCSDLRTIQAKEEIMIKTIYFCSKFMNTMVEDELI